MLLYISWLISDLSPKKQVFKEAFISENGTRRAQIEKIRSFFICNIPPIIYKKWSYFFNFRPLSLRKGNKGQNQGQSSRTLVYLLLDNFLGQQSSFWYEVPPQKVSSIFVVHSKIQRGVRNNWGEGRLIFPAFFYSSVLISHRNH